MTEAFTRPGREIVDRLSGRRAINSASHVFAPDDAKHFNVHNVWCGLIVVGG